MPCTIIPSALIHLSFQAHISSEIQIMAVLSLLLLSTMETWGTNVT